MVTQRSRPFGHNLHADATGVCREGKPAYSLTMPQPRCVGGGPLPVNSPASLKQGGREVATSGG